MGKNRIAILFLLLLLAVNLYAYQLSPLSATFQPSGIDSAKTYTLTNDSDSPIAIEFTVKKRFLDLDGNEYLEDAPQYFSIQPSKMIIKPQSTQIVRVQYRGPKTVTKEMSFRIISEQIAYSKGASEKNGGQMINFLFVYSTAAYVAPTKIVERVNAKVDISDGKLVVSLKNTGSVHQLLDSLSVTLHGDNGSTYSLTSNEIESINGINLLTDSSVNIVLDAIPEALSGASSFDVEISYDYSYSI